MKSTVMLEVFVDLVLEDVLNGGTLFEANPYHDAGGKFTSKESAKAYASGAMAKGRAAGLKAKAQGLGHEQIRAAIKDAMAKHVSGGGTRAEGQGRLGLIRTKIAKGTLPGQVSPGIAKKEVRPGFAGWMHPTEPVKAQGGASAPALDKKLDRTLEKGKRIVDRQRAMVTALAGGLVGDMERAGYQHTYANDKGTAFYQHPQTKDTVMVSRFIEKGWMADPDKHGVLIKRVDQSVMAAEKARNAAALKINDHPEVGNAIAKAYREGGQKAGEQEFDKQMATLRAKKELNDPTLSAQRGAPKSDVSNATTANDRFSHDQAHAFHIQQMGVAQRAGDMNTVQAHDAAAVAHKKALDAHVNDRAEAGMLSGAAQRASEATQERHPAVKAAVDAVKKAGAEGGSEAAHKEFTRQVMGLLNNPALSQPAPKPAAAQPTVTIGKITKADWNHETMRVTQAMDRHGVAKAEAHLRRRLDAIRDPKKMVAAGMALENENFHGLAKVARAKAMAMGVSHKQAHAPEFAF